MTERRTLALENRVETLERRMDAMERTGVKNTKAIASDGMLDEPYGDPVIGMQEPRDWRGKSYAGYRMSDCAPEYLDAYAEMKDRFAESDDCSGRRDTKGRSTAAWKRKDAALARGWAQRIRGGWKSSGRHADTSFTRDMAELEGEDKRTETEKFVEDADDEIPF